MKSDTPRTDAELARVWHGDDLIDPDFARQLERELSHSLENQVKSQEDIERLTRELATWDYGTRAKREQERANKAEAEVETLKKLTEDCLNVIRVYCPTYYQDAMERFKQTNK